MPVAAMTSEQFAGAYVSISGKEVPAPAVRIAREALRRVGVGNPTEAELAQYLTKKGMLK